MDAERVGGAEPPLQPVSRDTPPPLSFGQHRLWFLHELAPDDAAHHLPVHLRLRGPLDAGALERALNEIVRRHEVLRTCFVAEGDEPRQVVRPAPRLPLTPRAVREAEAARLARAEAEAPFDLAAGPPIRAALFRLGCEDHVLSVVVHHAVSDGWSLHLLLDELSRLYGAFRAGRPSPLAEPRLQYADFASWQRRRLTDDAVAGHVAFWRRQLQDPPGGLALPADHPRPALPTSRGATARFEVRPATTAALRRLGRGVDASLFATLLAGFQVLLARYSGQTDVLVGTQVAGRRRVELQTMPGFFVNTLVLRGDLTGRPSFRELLVRTRRTVVDALAHAELPFEHLVEALDVPRDMRQTPLFQVMLVLEGAGSRPELDGLEVGDFGGEDAPARFDLTLTVTDAGELLAGRLVYRRDLFEPATARRTVRHLERLLAAAAADPDRSIHDLPLLAPRERERLLAMGHGPRSPLPELLVHEQVARQAARTPDAVAVEYEGRRLTYRELVERADGLAGRLRAMGARPDEPVAVSLERGADLVVAALGVLCSGAAYLPLDPAHPAERREFILRDAGASIVLTDVSPRPGPPPTGEGRIGGDNLAYVIYTSGSTGRPKGVAVPHLGVANVVRAFAAALDAGPGDVLLAVTTPTFDIAVLELLLPLTTGGRLVLGGPRAAADPEELSALVARTGATLLQATPSTWRLLVESGWRGAPGLRALSGGEPLPRDLADALLDRCRAVWNGYGPTEATIYATLARVRRGGRVTVGRPVDNVRAHVVDRWGGAAPPGVPGELWLGGAGVARGYLGRPDLTGERFVPDPFGGGPGERLYRTGDVARWRPDGQLELLGRADRQVKIMGHRVELGEIEAVLRTHPDVREAAVEVRDGLLAAYVVATGEPALVAYLTERLPGHMVPASVTRLDALPLTPGGKLDRRALPAPRCPAAARSLRPDEQAMAAVWAEVLGVDTVRPQESFFDLGGSSYQALHVLRRIEETSRLVLPLADFLRRPTLEGLADLVGSRRPARPWSPLVRIQAGDRLPPLFAAPPHGGQPGYLELARALGRRRPVYGLESRGLSTGRPWRTVGAMARSFVDAVRSVRPRGPYFLCGYAFGALLAVEMARRLEAAGGRVGLVALVDPPAPRTAPPERPFDEAGFWAHLVGRRLGLPFEEVLASLQGMTAGEQVEWTIQKLEGAGRMPQDWAHLGGGLLRRALRVECANTAAQWRHVVRPYHGAAVVIEGTLGTTAERLADVRAWRGVVRGGVRIHEVATDHCHIVWERAAVAEVASILSGYMEEAEQRSPPPSRGRWVGHDPEGG